MDQEFADARAVRIDPDYSDRAGYNPDFLGPGEHRVDLPQLSRSQARLAVRITGSSGTSSYVLNYHHFTVVMNRARRLVFFTAVNIDGAMAQRLPRESDRWSYDPRIDRAMQIGPELYSDSNLDLGHLVRRLDPAWGESTAVARAANDDTFHFTNCAPQHKLFNRNKSTWAGLEDYILTNAITAGLKVSVFTGPVFRKDDPVYRGIQLPQGYWKVVAMVRSDHRLSATAYQLDQSSLMGDIEKGIFTYGAYKTFQVRIQALERTTRLEFGRLAEADPLAGAKDITPREIASFSDIVW